MGEKKVFIIDITDIVGSSDKIAVIAYTLSGAEVIFKHYIETSDKQIRGYYISDPIEVLLQCY